MTIRDDFTETEWDRLTQMPTLAAFGAMAAEQDGPLISTRELWAGMMELAHAARDRYPANALIQAIVQAITQREDGGDLTVDDWRASGPLALGEAVVETALETAAEVRQILAERAPDEAADYVAWIMGIARAGVEATRSGFLGMSGTQITEQERQFLDDLGAALGAPRQGQDSSYVSS